jgi:fatty-acyl-CoA synthase
VFFVDSYPMTASGKVQEFKLRELGVAWLKERGIEPV